MVKIREKQTEQLEKAASKGLKLGGWKKMTLSSKIAAVVLVLGALTAILAPLLAPYSPVEIFTARQAPGNGFIFGTDDKGRDILSRMLYGGRYSLIIGFGATAMALVCGSVVGALAAVSRKAVSETIMRILDIIMSIPGIALAAVFVSILGNSVPSIIFAIGFMYTPQFARIVRANIVSEFGEDYVRAVIVSGAKAPWILIKHVLRNCIAPIMVFTVTLVADAIDTPEAVYQKDGITITVKQTIADELNRRGFRTRTGREFKVNSLDNMLTNPKYIGTFTYETDISIENGCPALISHDIYDKVQELIKHTKKAPARAKAKVEYYLAGRLKCGICGESMIAVGGTSQNGTQHHYYRCKCRGKGCNKKPEWKDFLEWYITEQVLALLNMEEHKERLAEKIIAAYKSGMETNKTEEYKRQIQITESKLNNVLDLLIEKKSDSLMKKLDELELRKSELEEQLRSAELAQSHIPTKRDIIEWFDRLSNVDGCENSLQRQVIHAFVKEVFLWDDHAVIVLTLNNTQEAVTFEEILEFEQFSDETQEPLSDESESGSCSIEFGSPDWT